MPTTDIEICPHDVHLGASSTPDNDEYPKDVQHAGLRRVAGPTPWLLFLICVVEVRRKIRTHSKVQKLTQLQSLENASYTLESVLHCRITSSKESRQIESSWT